jgi:hypothetical protein
LRPGRMRSLLFGVSTTYLALDEYVADFGAVSEKLAEPIWKLERLQSFREPGNRSWEAFVAGRWGESLQLAEKDRSALREYFASLGAQGSGFFRVRVVTRPLTPYLQWALHVIRVRLLAGEHIRVVSLDTIAPVEVEHGQLPELVLLGSRAGYAVDYGEDGTPQGAFKFTERDAIDECRLLLSRWYEAGEDLEVFFDREVLPLPRRPTRVHPAQSGIERARTRSIRH